MKELVSPQPLSCEKAENLANSIFLEKTFGVDSLFSENPFVEPTFSHPEPPNTGKLPPQ